MDDDEAMERCSTLFDQSGDQLLIQLFDEYRALQDSYGFLEPETEDADASWGHVAARPEGAAEALTTAPASEQGATSRSGAAVLRRVRAGGTESTEFGSGRSIPAVEFLAKARELYVHKRKQPGLYVRLLSAFRIQPAAKGPDAPTLRSTSYTPSRRAGAGPGSGGRPRDEVPEELLVAARIAAKCMERVSSFVWRVLDILRDSLELQWEFMELVPGPLRELVGLLVTLRSARVGSGP